MSAKNFYQVTSIIFVIVGFLHLIRIVTGYNLVYAGFEIPTWLSAIAGLFLFYLAYSAYKLGSKRF